MSRLRALYLPFAKGQNDAVAREVLPDGFFASLTNARFNKEGQLTLRRGWRPVTMTDTDGTAVTARDLYSMNGSLVALTTSASTALPGLAVYANPATARPWVTAPGRLTPVVDVAVCGGVPASDLNVLRASAALTSDVVYGAVLTQNGTASATAGQLRVFRQTTDETVFFAALASATQLRKVVSLGTTFGVVRATGSALVLEVLDPAAASPGLAAPVTLATTAATVFDAVTAVPSAVGGTPGGLYLAYVDAGAVSFAKFSLAGVQSGSTKTVSASGASQVALASDDSRVHCLFQASVAKTLDLLTFNATTPYATTAGPTTVVASAVKPAWFVLGVDAGGRATVAAQEDGVTSAGPTCFVATRSASHAVSSFGSRGETLVVGGFVHATGATAATGSAFTAGRDSAWLCLDVSASSQPWFVLHGVGTRALNTITVLPIQPFAPAQAPDGTCLVFGRTGDNQLLLRRVSLSTTTRRQGVVGAGGELYISGGVLTRWAGVIPAETSFLAPVLDAVAASNTASGALTSSVQYAYRALVEWVDSRGVTHQGEVSLEKLASTGVGDDTMSVTAQLPPAAARTSNLPVGPSLKLFRTEAGPGELFYLTATVEDISRTVDAVVVVDVTSDADLIDNERLYTEGDTGATSGRLDNVLTRPSRYLAATRDRLVSAATGLEYQFSQLALSGEPVEHTDPGVSGPAALVYFDQVTEDLTAVAALDDSVVLATKTQLYVVSGGEGPNFAGVGEFPSAARLPTNVGVYDWRSLVESGEGLWFLGDVDKLYLLGRGQSSPEWVGKAVEDRLGAGATLVGAGLDVADHVLLWALSNGTAVVRDLQLQQWSGDTLPFTAAALASHQGELWAVSSTGAVWRQALTTTTFGDGAAGATAVAFVAETGDLQVFGLGGWGRLGTLELEGVFETAAALKLEVSYDQGLSWTDLGTQTVTGLAVGEVFQRSWDPARQRGGKFRLRLTMTPSATTGEGCRLTGLTVNHTTRPGPTRLSSTKRL